MGGTSEVHAAIDADLPLSSLAPWTRVRLVAPTSDSLGPVWPVSEDCQSSGTFGSGIGRVGAAFSKVVPRPPPDSTAAGPVPESRGSRVGGGGQGLAGIASRPRAIAAPAIAVQAARVGAPLGRLSVDRRAYTVNR